MSFVMVNETVRLVLTMSPVQPTQGEPTAPYTRQWRSGLWLCKGCGRIIYATREKAEVVGFAVDNTLSEWERYEILIARMQIRSLQR